MPKKIQNRTLISDRLEGLPKAAEYLGENLGTGWGQHSIRKKIKTNQPFAWIEDVHYFRTERGAIFQINVDAVMREKRPHLMELIKN